MKSKILKIGKITVVIFIMIISVFVYNFVTQHKKLGNSRLMTKFNTDTIPFTLSQSGHIIIDVAIGESKKTYPFLLDSGASNMIFINKKNKFNLDRAGWGFGIGAKGDFFISPIRKIKEIQIQDLIFQDVYSKEMDFDFDCQGQIYGIIGIGVMRNLVWQFDFQKKIIIVSKQLENLPISDERIKIPLTENRFSHHLKASIQMGGMTEDIEVLIDLGSNNTLTLGNRHFETTKPFLSKTISGIATQALSDDQVKKSKAKFYLIPTLRFNSSNSYSIEDIPAIGHQSGMNLLGVKFLSEYKTTISWKDKMLILEPQDTVQSFVWKTAGFASQFDVKRNKVFVTAIVEKTPASREKLPLNGEILAINGISFSNKRDHCNFDYRSVSIDTLDIKVRHRGRLKEYRIVKEPLF